MTGHKGKRKQNHQSSSALPGQEEIEKNPWRTQLACHRTAHIGHGQHVQWNPTVSIHHVKRSPSTLRRRSGPPTTPSSSYLAIGRKAPHVSSATFQNGDHVTQPLAWSCRAPSRSKRGAARCIEWTFTLNVNSDAMRSTCEEERRLTSFMREVVLEHNQSLRSTSIFLDGCLPSLWRVAAYWTECVDGSPTSSLGCQHLSQRNTSANAETKIWEIACPSKCWTRKETTSNSE